LIKTDGSTNEDFYTFGIEVIAPADGKITFARNDVPDNKKPGEIDSNVFMKMSDPIRAFPGNNVIIDHGNGEFSFLAHLKMGSVRIKTGDTVKAGQVIGLLGNSGNSDGPHLHYHLMAGPTVFKNDGLPSKFKNVDMEILMVEPLKIATLKRGIYFVAK
jgi:murein DD-endopeptidase MepM/ murein hydrolase activator NlpD